RVSASQEDGRLTVLVEAKGARVRLHPDVAAGLAGEALGEGLAGRWVQAYYLHVLLAASGGQVFVEPGEERINFRAVIPA
ncbi:MAG TPA: histidine phosphotransferase family protein, partial [Caulobacteraceae bacterium]